MDVNSLGELTRAAIIEGQHEHQRMLDEQERERLAKEEAMSQEAWDLLGTVPELAKERACRGETSSLIMYLTRLNFQSGLEPKIRPGEQICYPKLEGVAELVFSRCLEANLDPFVARGEDNVCFIAITLGRS